MAADPFRPADRLFGGTLGLIAVLVVLTCVLPVLFPYLVGLAVLAAALRAVWFYTRGW